VGSNPPLFLLHSKTSAFVSFSGFIVFFEFFFVSIPLLRPTMAAQDRLERKLVELAIEASEAKGTQKWEFLRDVLRQLQPQLKGFNPSLRVRSSIGCVFLCDSYGLQLQNTDIVEYVDCSLL
jgi:hypothetical protein